MAAPAGSNALSLGRQVIDLSQFGPDVPDSVRHAFQQLQDYLVGNGWACGARSGDTTYQAVYATVDTGVWTLWGGKPADPVNPDEIDNIAGSSANSFGIIVVSGQSNVEADQANDTLTLVAGTGVTLTTNAAGDSVTIAASGGGGASDSFVNIAVSGQSTVVADSPTDTLTLVAGAGITITTNDATDTITITNSGAANAFTTIAVAGQSNVVADSATDTLTLSAGSNITITTNATTDTVTIAATDTNTTYSAGLYLDLAGTTFDVDLTEALNYDGAARQFFWHESGVIKWQTISGYSAGAFQVLCKKADNTFALMSVSAMLAELTGYTLANNQSIGKDAADTPEWQDDTVCP